MNKLYSKEVIEDVANQFKFEGPEYIEKDCYITHIIQAISTLKDDNFSLVFAGGTCLAKAHRVISRMSEDVDFKIVPTNMKSSLSKSATRTQLSEFRSKITEKLNGLGYAIENHRIRSRDNNHYTNITLDYPTYFKTQAWLKPYIMLEFTFSDLRVSSVVLPVQSLVDDIIHGHNSIKSKNLTCVSLVETAAEKWVALTRRIASIARGHDPIDATLVRHLYDLHPLIEQIGITDELLQLAENTIERDRMKYKQHHEYQSNPVEEINYSLKILNNSDIWIEYFDKFVNTMVFEKKIMDYHESYKTLTIITDKVFSYLRCHNLLECQN